MQLLRNDAYYQLMAGSRTQMLPRCSRRDWNAVSSQVLRSSIIQTSSSERIFHKTDAGVCLAHRVHNQFNCGKFFSNRFVHFVGFATLHRLKFRLSTMIWGVTHRSLLECPASYSLWPRTQDRSSYTAVRGEIGGCRVKRAKWRQCARTYLKAKPWFRRSVVSCDQL